MSSPTKAKINLNEGIIELEGNEIFVTKYIEVFLKEMKQVPQPEKTIKEPKKESDEKERETKKQKRKASTKSKAPMIVIPIPLDLKQSEDKPSLRTFVKEKSPSSYSEKITVFAYYLKKYLNIEKIEAGHVVSCCKEIKSRVPKQINMLFYDIKRHFGWIDLLDGRKYGVITTAGENLVEYDLPREKNVTSNKTTT